MYVADLENGRVQVFDSRGRFQRAFGQEGEGKLERPSSLLLADKHVYVTDNSRNCVLVYDSSGDFVASFGGPGANGGLYGPRGITSCPDGFVYVCDQFNNRVVTF